MIRISVWLAALFLAFVPVGAAYAVGEDVFVVPRVAVQASANTATGAKSLAQRQGRRRAIDLLLRRLTVEDDWAYLPQVQTGEQIADETGTGVYSPQITLDDRALENLESGFEVYSEKSSARTYRAFITYRFKPDAVRDLLKQAGIAYSEAQTRTALVVPVLQTANGVYLWESNNPWMAAWKVRPYDNELTPMVAPLGDLEDSGSISARAALSVDERSLAGLAERYSVPQVIVAHAFLQQRDGNDRLRVRFINGYNESAGVADEIDLDVEGYEGSGLGPDVIEEERIVQAQPGDILAEAWFSQPSGNFPALAERAIEEAIAKYAKPWKERTLIDHTQSSVLSVSAFYNSLSEWAQIRNALVSTPLVGGVQVSALSRAGAEMRIQAFGDPSKLVVAMEAQGLVLWSSDGQFWNIATPRESRIRKSDDRRRRSDNSLLPAGGVQPASFPAPGKQ